MENTKFNGLLAALITPFDKSLNVQKQVLAQLVQSLIRQGMDGFYVGGSTAEAFLLTEKQRMDILEVVLDAAGDKAAVICHVGAISTDTAERLAKHAQSAGAHAVSAISPFYYKFSEREILDYYKDIMKACSLPMFVYTFPANAGFSVSEPFIKELDRSGKLAGVKFTSLDLFLMERMITLNPELTVWNGYDEVLLSGLSAGAHGGVGSTYNAIPRLIRGVYDSFKSGDIKKARQYQQKANGVIEAMCRYGVIPSIKYWLALSGIDAGACLRPFAGVSEEGKAHLQSLYAAYCQEA